MAVKRITYVTKPEQLPKLASGPIHIVLRPNLRIRNKNKGNKIFLNTSIREVIKKDNYYEILLSNKVFNFLY